MGLRIDEAVVVLSQRSKVKTKKFWVVGFVFQESPWLRIFKWLEQYFQVGAKNLSPFFMTVVQVMEATCNIF
jgi:hypothetical protein